MKKLFIAVALLLWSVSAEAQTLVQKSAAAVCAASGNPVATLPAGTTSGNFVVVAISSFTATSATVSDPANVLTQRINVAAGGGSTQRTMIFAKAGVTAGATGFTVTPNVQGDICVAAAEFSGVASAAEADGTITSAPAGATTAATSGNLATTNAADLLIAVVGHGPSGTITQNAAGSTGAWTLLHENESGTNAEPFSWVFQVVGSTGTYTHNWTIPSGNYAAGMIAVKSSGPPDTVPPTPPTNPQMTVVSSNEITMTYSLGSDDRQIINTRIERCAGAGCVNFLEVAQVANPGTSFADSGLTANTLYRYRARHFDGTNFSTYTTIVQATTLAARQATLTWTDTVNTDHTSYVIQRKTGVSGTYADLVSVGAAVRQYIDSTSPQPIACYRIRAVRSAENGPQSAEVCTTTSAPAAPVNLVLGGKIGFGGANNFSIRPGLVPFYTALQTPVSPISCSDIFGSNVVDWSHGYNGTPDTAPAVRLAWKPGSPARGYLCVQANDPNKITAVTANDDANIYAGGDDYLEVRFTPTTSAQIAGSYQYAVNAAGFFLDAVNVGGVDSTAGFNSNMSCSPSGTWEVFCAFDFGFPIVDNQFGLFQMLLGDADPGGFTWRIVGGAQSDGVNVPANFRIIKFSSSQISSGLQFSTTLWVSPTGSGSACSAGAPCSLSTAVTQAAPGVGIVMKDGTWTTANGQGGASNVLRLVCSGAGANATSGTANSPITITSENARKAKLLGNGRGATVQIGTGCQYWNLENLQIANADDNTYTGSDAGNVFLSTGSSNITIRNNLVYHANTYVGAGNILLSSSSSNLVEGNEVYQCHRNCISILGGTNSQNNVMRGNYVSQGTTSHCGSNLNASFAAVGCGPNDAFVDYQTSNNIWIANISDMGSTACSGDCPGLDADFYVKEGSLDSRFYGNIAMSASNGFLTSDNGATHRLEDFVSVGNALGVWAAGQQNLTARHLGIFTPTIRAVRADDATNGFPTAPLISSFTNTLAIGAGSGVGGFTKATTTLAVNGSAVFTNDYNPGGSSFITLSGSAWSLTSTSTTAPTNMASCKVFIPATSNMKGVGQSGADIGPRLLYSYDSAGIRQDGTGGASTVKLWDSASGFGTANYGRWRYAGAVIAGVNDAGSYANGRVAGNVHDRVGFGASGTCQLPAGY